jgi:hypothetical protein
MIYTHVSKEARDRSEESVRSSKLTKMWSFSRSSFFEVPRSSNPLQHERAGGWLPFSCKSLVLERCDLVDKHAFLHVVERLVRNKGRAIMLT